MKTGVKRKKAAVRTTYAVFTRGKSINSSTRLLDASETLGPARKLAKRYHEDHPDRLVGTFRVQRLQVFKPTKPGAKR